MRWRRPAIRPRAQWGHPLIQKSTAGSLARRQAGATNPDTMTYVGSVNLMVNGRVVTIPVAKIMYQNVDDYRPPGGVVENADGSLQIILDGRLSEEAADRSLETAMEEISKRVTTRAYN